MAKRKFSRFRGKKRKRRKKRQSFKKKVMKIINANIEHKFIVTTASGDISTTVENFVLNMPARGTDNNDRIGNEIRVKMFQLTVQVLGASGGANVQSNHPMRMWVLWMKNPAQTVFLPTFNEHWKYEENPGVFVMMDFYKTFSATTVEQENNTIGTTNTWISKGAGPSYWRRTFKWNMKNRKMKFDDAFHTQGRIAFITLGLNADTAGSVAGISINTKMWFVDP